MHLLTISSHPDQSATFPLFFFELTPLPLIALSITPPNISDDFIFNAAIFALAILLHKGEVLTSASAGVC